jgi:hypothetical protein
MLTNVYKMDTLITIATQMQPVLILQDRLPALATQVSVATAPAVLILTNVQQTLIIATLMQHAAIMKEVSLVRVILVTKATALTV